MNPLSQQELHSILNVQLGTESYAKLCVDIIAKQVAQIKERRDNCDCGGTEPVSHSNPCTLCYELAEVECNTVETIQAEDFFKLSKEHQGRLINVCHINVIGLENFEEIIDISNVPPITSNDLYAMVQADAIAMDKDSSEQERSDLINPLMASAYKPEKQCNSKEFQAMNTNLQYKFLELDNGIISDPENLKSKIHKKYEVLLNNMKHRK